MVTLILDRFISGVKQSKFALFIFILFYFPTQKPLGGSHGVKTPITNRKEEIPFTITNRTQNKKTKTKQTDQK
jgi:hypothetical protein